MKTTKSFKWLLPLSFLLFSCNPGIKDYDGNNYKAVKIGEQIWLTENLKVTHFRNGDEIPQAKTAEEWVIAGKSGKPAWCYYESGPENGNKYGVLYNWFAITDPRGISPDGWHVATDDEWTIMINSLGGGVLAALQMRVENMAEQNKEKAGFHGLPAGCRNQNGAFYGSGSYGYWWSSTEEVQGSAWMRVLNYANCDVNFMSFPKIYGASVRCLKN